jgi:formate dehydrogenase gamma subunit
MRRAVSLGLMAGFALALAAVGAAQTPARDQNANCLGCHGQQELQDSRGRSLYVDEAKFQASAHGSLDCTSCHTAVKDYPHPDQVARVDCSSCHSDEAKELSGSVHRNGADSPNCLACHQPEHNILPADDPASSTAKKNLPNTCGACHSNPRFLAQHQIPFAHPVEAYWSSVHGRAVAQGNQSAPSCSDCHGSHGILTPQDSHSKISSWNIPNTCGACHTEIRNTYLASVHGQAMLHGSSGAPVCTDCHGEHVILPPSNPASTVSPANVSTVTCGRCHSDVALDRRYNLPADRVPTFAASYHGLALSGGAERVANCASCHGVHNILPASDPRSSINPANLAATCGHCHAGAGTRFAIGPIHVTTSSAEAHPVVRWIRVFYLVIIMVTVGFMLLHNGLDFVAKLVRNRPVSRSEEQVARMNLHYRIAHWLVVLSFPVLVITGFALKYPDTGLVLPVRLLEIRYGFSLRGYLHRVAAVVLVLALVYHFVHLLVSRRDRPALRALWPRARDFADLIAMLRYNLGIAPEAPEFGKFSYGEKLEYWAFLWGTSIMALTGFLLWFVNFTLRHFPKWVTDAATAVHFYEAILATLAIVVWHLYAVIFDPDVYPMDRAWITGETSADHLRHRRPTYYQELVKQGEETAAVPAEVAAAKPPDTESESKPEK